MESKRFFSFRGSHGLEFFTDNLKNNSIMPPIPASSARFTLQSNKIAGGEVTIFDKRYILKWLLFHCQVSFQGCMS